MTQATDDMPLEQFCAVREAEEALEYAILGRDELHRRDREACHAYWQARNARVAAFTPEQKASLEETANRMHAAAYAVDGP